MATRWAVQNGNWSDTATWDGGTLPTSADDVHADGKTVTINQDINVLTLRTTQRSGGTIGGGFVLTPSVVITCTASQGIIPGTTTCVTCSDSAPATWTINASIGANSGSNIGTGVLISGSGTLTVTGSIPARSAGTFPIVITSGHLTLVGDATSQFGNNGYGVAAIYSTGASSSVLVTGNVSVNTGSTNGGNASSAIFSSGVSSTVSVTGNLTGGITTTVGVIYSLGTVVVVGNVVGGTNVNSRGIWNAGSGETTVTGSVSSGTVSGADGIYSQTSNTTIIGSVISTNTLSHAVRHDSGTVVITGNITDHSSGTTAVYSRLLRVNPSLNSRTVYANSVGFPNGASVVRASLDVAGDHPLPANVRQGTSYAYSQFTGAMAVPSPNAVSFGVPVDNTVGTALVTAADLAAVTGAQIAAALST